MKISLKAKAILMIMVVGLLIGIASVVVFDRGISNLTTSEYESRSIDISYAMAAVLDANEVKILRDTILSIYNAEDKIVLSDQWGTPEFDEYISHYSEIENMSEFTSLREQLRKVQDVIDVDCLYIIWADWDAERYVYLVDAAYEYACPPGCVDPLYVDDVSEWRKLSEGCMPNITHTEEYGYLMTTAMPIKLSGEIVGYAAVDLSMNEIVARKNSILLTSVLVFGVVTIIASIIGIIAVDRTIVRPINKLSEVAKTYNAKELQFSRINIHTGDEIESLANSMKSMEEDIRDYYKNLTLAKSDLETAKEHVEVYRREANVDFLTNLQNKRAYELTVEKLDDNPNPYALVMIDFNDLKEINDKYGHEKGDIAIKSLANLICDIFKDSQVFRFGGDEFVVILTDDNIKECEKYISVFRGEVEKSSKNNDIQPWERVSAACGYAIYDGNTDEDVANVFKRADEDMYKQKVKMKGSR